LLGGAGFGFGAGLGFGWGLGAGGGGGGVLVCGCVTTTGVGFGLGLGCAFGLGRGFGVDVVGVVEAVDEAGRVGDVAVLDDDAATSASGPAVPAQAVARLMRTMPASPKRARKYTLRVM
jgi:hypothetical protein